VEEINVIYRQGLKFRYVNDISELLEVALLKEKVDQPMSIV
jgi:ATP-dependent Lon protease